MLIFQGDKGIKIPFQVKRKEVETLEGATVKVFIKRGEEILEKIATVLDPIEKLCEFEMGELDLTISGIYRYQYTVTSSDGEVIATGSAENLPVDKKLSGNTTIVLDGGTF